MGRDVGRLAAGQQDQSMRKAILVVVAVFVFGFGLVGLS